MSDIIMLLSVGCLYGHSARRRSPTPAVPVFSFQRTWSNLG